MGNTVAFLPLYTDRIAIENRHSRLHNTHNREAKGYENGCKSRRISRWLVRAMNQRWPKDHLQGAERETAAMPHTGSFVPVSLGAESAEEQAREENDDTITSSELV